MKSMVREIADIVDMVEEEPGWRVEGTRRGWQIYPPDKSLPIIQASSFSTDLHAAENLRAQLRRANFAPLLRTRKPIVIRSTDSMPLTNGKATDAPTPPAVAVPVPRNLIREARAKIQDALDALGAIDSLLGEIEGDQLQMQRFKELVAAMLK